MESSKLKVAIVGGGLVGSLSACYFAKRGHDVDVYEYRKDIRSSDMVQGKSINLALSTRGRKALRQIGIDEAIIQNHGIAMRARMVHAVDGALNVIPYDSLHNECIYSVGRKYLNEILLTETEKYSNVKLHFEHKFTFGNLKTGEMTFQKVSNNSSVTAVADLIVGADGAFSAVRRQMMKLPMFNYNQTYIEHGYLELCIPPTPDKYFAMPPNYLHIWPRGTFMMIALPNQDFSWTVTLFMPFNHFAMLDSPNALVCFFESHFPDVIPLIGNKRLITDFFTAKPSHLVSIKCDPYHVGNKSVIVGDAAHAMVPFYGQGMNAGFEDCSLLDELMTQHSHDLGVVLRLFSESRNRDAHAICDLAMYNYIEMRDLVNRRSFLWRKKLDNFLFWLLPKTWIPLYNSVTFSDMKYSQCIQNKKWQDKIVNRIIFVAGVFGTSIVALATAVQFQRTELRPLVYSVYDQLMVNLFNAPSNA